MSIPSSTPCIEVTLPGSGGIIAPWNLCQLSDRWGEVLPHAPQLLAEKVGADSELHARLCLQMWDEVTFIAHKDDQFGLLFEIEYESIESDAREGAESGEDSGDDLRPYATVAEQLLRDLVHLQEQFPEVQFCVPEPGAVYKGRPAVWGFAADGALTDERRERLGHMLLEHAYPAPRTGPVTETVVDDESESTLRP